MSINNSTTILIHSSNSSPVPRVQASDELAYSNHLQRMIDAVRHDRDVHYRSYVGSDGRVRDPDEVDHINALDDTLDLLCALKANALLAIPCEGSA